MKILVVEDEDGIREGLASYLRHHQHVVHTAASCVEACAVVASQEIDVVVTDWRLIDGTARPLLETGVPAIVITGCPEEIDAGGVPVLRKPVLPDAILAHIATHARPRTVPAAADPLASLPTDTQDRIRLLLHGLSPSSVEIDDDGTFATVTIALADGVAPPHTLLARLGGDWSQTWTREGRPIGRWRSYRDGRPPWVTAVIGPDDPWPACNAFAIDLHGRHVPLDAMLALLDRADAAHAADREVHLLNVPGHLRLWLELLGRAHRLPMRTCSGPRLSAATRQLWN